MSERPDHTNSPNSLSRFTRHNLKRAQEGTLADIEYAESADGIISAIDAHYRSDDELLTKPELIRLQRFAKLASYGLAVEDRQQGAQALYQGELLALDQGCRIFGHRVFPSDQIQLSVQALLKDIPDPLARLGKLNDNLEPITVPKNAADLQRMRTEQWGTAVYEQATLAMQTEDLDLTPLQETVIQLTSGYEERWAEQMKVGFWLVMRHLISPAPQPTIVIPAEESIRSSREESAAYSAQILTEMFPEMQEGATSTLDLHYENIDDLKTYFVYKYLSLKGAYKLTEDREVIKEQQVALEKDANALLESSFNLSKGSSLQVSGEFLFYTPAHSGGSIQAYPMPELDTIHLRGEFDGITVKRAHTNKAFDEYAASDFMNLPDEYDPLMPHIKLKNAMLINLDGEGQSIEVAYDEVVEVPLLYKDAHLSQLVDNFTVEP